MKQIILFASACLFLAAPVAAKKAPLVDEPAQKPDFAAARKRAEASIRTELIDPESARFTWTSGFQWGYAKPALMKRDWAWIACVSVNSKNQMGGYAGQTAYWYAISPTNSQGWGRVLDAQSLAGVITQCNTPNRVPLQPELAAVDTPTTQVPSSADELQKLAALMEKGLLTRAEFDAQKARLLSGAGR